MILCHRNNPPCDSRYRKGDGLLQAAFSCVAAVAAASWMSLAVSFGKDMYATWLAFTSTVLALARFAIMRSCSGLIDRSSVATMYPVGLVFQAGDVTLCVNASVEIGTCSMAMKLASAAGMSAAKSAAKCA